MSDPISYMPWLLKKEEPWASVNTGFYKCEMCGNDITKEITVESSSNNSTWTTRFSGTASAGTSTKTCRLTSYGGDNYIRVTIEKGTSSTNSVRMSQIRLMTLRA